MKFSFSAATAIVIFFITLVFSNPLIPTTSLVVKEQRRVIIPEPELANVRYIPTHRPYSIGILIFSYNVANHTSTLKQGAIKCNTDRFGHTNWASSRHTRKNYEWLFRNSGEWKAKAGQTGRVRCSRNAAIYVLNTVRRHPFLLDLLLPPLTTHTPAAYPPPPPPPKKKEIERQRC